MLGIIFIYLPVPHKNVRVFIVLVVLATNKEFYAHCDKPEAIFLNNRQDLHLGERESIVSFLIIQALKRDKKRLLFIMAVRF